MSTNTRERLLMVVAHPDDETFGCGSVLLHATTRGAEAIVACATRGELGEIAPGLAIDPARLGEAREAQLRAAATALGVSRVEMLGWRDSGMDGEAAAGSLAAAAVDDVARAVARVIDDVRPTLVVTPDASDGHRDHAAIRDATMRAIELAEYPPARVYLWCMPRSVLSRFEGFEAMGTADELVTTVVDVREHLDRRWRAIRLHASQAAPFDAMPPALADAFLTADHLIRVVPPWPGGALEPELVSE
jgi:N-acetyl-1-D-myo-inositol-2-amino-2-deoxy-alpha-D-glucopyranoside deacetylase